MTLSFESMKCERVSDRDLGLENGKVASAIQPGSSISPEIQPNYLENNFDKRHVAKHYHPLQIAEIRQGCFVCLLSGGGFVWFWYACAPVRQSLPFGQSPLFAHSSLLFLVF